MSSRGKHDVDALAEERTGNVSTDNLLFNDMVAAIEARNAEAGISAEEIEEAIEEAVVAARAERP